MATNRLLRRAEIEERLGVSCTTIYRLMRAGKFPLPIKVGPKAVRWHQSDIEDYLTSRPLATGEAA